MQYRDSSVASHFTRGVAAMVDSSHGVKLSEAYGAGSSVSTGGLIEPIGDDANISLRLLPAGSGLLILGSTQASVRIGSDSTNSTTALSGIQRYIIQYTPTALSSGPAFNESTITVTGLTTNAVLSFTARTNPTGAYTYMVRCSTAAELRFSEGNMSASTIGTGESTSRGTLLEYRF